MRAQGACEFCTDKGTKNSENYCVLPYQKKTTHEDTKQNYTQPKRIIQIRRQLIG